MKIHSFACSAVGSAVHTRRQQDGGRRLSRD
jgi:hypothetical protein